MDWLKCNICFNTYNESSQRPRSLSCGHTFCERCLNNTIQNDTLTCPQCRKKHELNSVIELPINFTLEGLLKSLNTCSQNENEGAISKPIKAEPGTKPIKEEPDTDDKSDIHGSLKCLLEQQERSLSSQKELLKTSAGMCMEHPSKECMFRCSLHISWVCELCINEQGDHYSCKITTFKEEIDERKQGHKRSLDDEGKSCDEILSVIERHISYLRDERECHISLINSLQDLINMHKNEEVNLQQEMTSFLEIIQKGKNMKQKLLDVEATVLKVATLDESNSARDIVKSKKVEARNWVNSSQKEVDDGKFKIERSTNLAMATKISLEHRQKYGLVKQEPEKNIKKSEPVEKLAKKRKLRDIEFTRKNLNKIAHLYENELNDVAKSRKEPWNFWDSVIKVQLILLGLLSKISDAKGGKTTTWAVKASKDCSVLAGQLVISNDRLLLQSMQTYDNLPLNAITLPFDAIMDLVPNQPVAFLTLTHCGYPLGSLHIHLDGMPRRAQHFMELSTGSSGRGGYKNARFKKVHNKGNPGEHVSCKGYTKAAGGLEVNALPLHQLENEPCTSEVTKGVIIGYSGMKSGFWIITKAKPNDTNKQPVIGHVTSGLHVFKAAILKHNVKDIAFSNCGVFIDSDSNVEEIDHLV